MKTFKLCNVKHMLITLSSILILILISPLAANAASQGPSGGTGGGAFFDQAGSNNAVHSLRVRSGSWLDAIQVEFISPNGTHILRPQRGGNGGSQRTIHLAPGEDITSVTGYYSNYVRSLYLRTSAGRSYSFGIPRGRYFSYYRPAGSKFIGIKGASGSYLDSLGVIWK